jgi:hypothetical protein
MGPGIIEADMPTVKPRKRALASSIMMAPRKKSGCRNIESNYIKNLWGYQYAASIAVIN